MIGAIVGDIVGSIYEFDNIKTKDFPLFGKGCNFTDDTILTVAVADSLLHSQDPTFFGILCERKLYRYANRYPEPMGGYGNGFMSWVWTGGRAPYYSCGNGSAMRCSPCGFAAKDIEEAELLGRLSAMGTHNHPEGIKGAEAVSAAVYLAKSGFDKDQIRKYIESIYYEIDDLTVDIIRPTYKFESTCQMTVPQALVAFFDSTDFEDAIRNGVSLGGDSDTICAITGAVAGAYYGVPNDIRDKALLYLPESLKETVLEFEEEFET